MSAADVSTASSATTTTTAGDATTVTAEQKISTEDTETTTATATSTDEAAAQSAATAAAWEQDADCSPVNMLDLCRSCGKPNATLYDLFNGDDSIQADNADVAGNVDSVVAEHVAEADAEHDSSKAPCTNTSESNTASTATATAIKVNDSVATVGDVSRDKAAEKTHAAASSTPTAAAIAAATACASAKATAQGQSNMENIVQEMQIWQLRIRANDGLPQRICPKCTAQFYIIHKFRRKCLKVQIRLRALLEEQCLEQEQQLLQEQDEATSNLNVPPVLDIGNELTNANYGQPLNEVELFESDDWNVTDATLVDADANKQEVAATQDADDIVEERLHEEAVEDLEPCEEESATAQALQQVLDEESMLAKHVIFKENDSAMESCGVELDEQMVTECFEEGVDYYEETLIERCEPQDGEEMTAEAVSELEQMEILSNVELLTTTQNACVEQVEKADSIIATKKVEALTASVMNVTATTSSASSIAALEAAQSAEGDAVESEAHNTVEKPTATRSVEKSEFTADSKSLEACSENQTRIMLLHSNDSEPNDKGAPSDNHAVAVAPSVETTASSSSLSDTTENSIVTKAALKSYGSPVKPATTYRVKHSLRLSLKRPMARLSSSSTESPPLLPASVTEIDTLATSSALTHIGNLSANISATQILSTANDGVETQENVHPTVPEVSRPTFSGYNNAKRGCRLKWRGRGLLQGGARKHRRIAASSEHSVRPQLPTCFVRLRRLQLDRWVCETDFTESTGQTAHESRNVLNDDAVEQQAQELRRAEEIVANEKYESESEIGCLARKRKHIRKRKYASDNEDVEEAVRRSPWRTKAEMKENIVAEQHKLLLRHSEVSNASIDVEKTLTGEAAPEAGSERLTGASEGVLAADPNTAAASKAETASSIQRKRGRKPKATDLKVSKIVLHRNRYKCRKGVQIAERRSKRIRKRLKGYCQMSENKSADESVSSDKSDGNENTPSDKVKEQQTTVKTTEMESVKSMSDSVEVACTPAVLEQHNGTCAKSTREIPQDEISDISCKNNPQISTPLDNKQHSAAPKDNCDNLEQNAMAASISLPEEKSKSAVEAETETQALPAKLIVRIPLSVVNVQLQNMLQKAQHQKELDTVGSISAFDEPIKQVEETMEKWCPATTADCSPATKTSHVNNITPSNPPPTESNTDNGNENEMPVHPEVTASTASVTCTPVADDKAEVENEPEAEVLSHCSQYDSEQSEFLGFAQETDTSNQLNTSSTSMDSQDSIELPRCEDLNTSLTASSKIHDFINEFQAHCIDPSELEADEEDQSLQQQQQQLQDSMNALHASNSSVTFDLQQQQQQPSSVQLLSESNLSEMQDVETTLSGILNEMQDQHIYTPVSSHTDDFFSQSVYSPLSDPPCTPTHSIYAESPMDGGGSVSGTGGTLSVASSPYAPNVAGVPTAETVSNIAPSTNDDNFSKNLSNYGECFTEDSTQSELIGFQNDIPCFENIELAAAAAAANTASTSATSVNSSPNSRMSGARTNNTNSALQGALPKSAAEANTQYLGMAHGSDEGNASINNINNSMELVCATSNGVQVHAPAYQLTAPTVSTASMTRQVQNVHVAGTSNTYVDNGEKEYAVDSATMQLAQLLNDLQPQQPQQQQTQQLIQLSGETAALTVVDSNNMSGRAKHLPTTTNAHATLKIANRNNNNAKLQYVTVGAGVSEGNQQQMQLANIDTLQMGGVSQGHLNLYTNVGPQEIQWTTSTGQTVTATATNVLDGQATTTTYYINASDLYQSDMISTTSTQAAMVATPALAPTTVATQVELDKCSMDANENYIEGMQQQQQQPIMIVIPHEFMQTDAGTTTANATQIYATASNASVNGSTTHDLSHALQIAQTPQTVLVQQQQQHQLALSAHNGAHHNKTNLHINAQYATANTPVASPSRHASHTSSPQCQQQRQHTVTPSPPTSVQQHQRNISTTPPQQRQQQLQQQRQQSSQPPEKVNLTCRFCHKRPKFTNNLDYSNHIIAMHPVETPFNCPLCPMHFTKRVKRQQHVLEEHGSHRFHCAQCGQNFSTQRALDLHLQRSHAPESPQKPLQNQSQTMLHTQHQRYLAHRNAWADGGNGGGLHQAQTQMVHVEDVHLHVSDVDKKDKKSIDLQLDGGQLSTKASTSTSSSQAGKQRILCCPDCDDPFDETHAHSHVHTQQQQEAQHQQEKSLHVTMPSPEQTEPDSTSTTTLRSFRKRRLSNTQVADATSSSSGSATAIAADGTGSTEDELLLMERALRTSHNCLFCEERFTNEISLRKHHQLAHSSQTTMPFVCSICKRGFRMRTALQRHMETHDSEGRPYECTLCHVRFPRPSQLTLHKLTVHFLKKPHTCNECGKQFGTESALKTHAKFHGERDVECDMCSRKFFLMKDMRKHRRIHTGERFYKCDLCASSFLHYTRLSAHMKTHLPTGVHMSEDMSIRQLQQLKPMTTTQLTSMESETQAEQQAQTTQKTAEQQQQQQELMLSTSSSALISTTATGGALGSP